MDQLLIIADDLSGAADCGAACAFYGLNTVVLLGEIADEFETEVLSIDGHTRCLSPVLAAARTEHLVRKYMRRNRQLLFKKVDSTLRGNVAVELAAVLAARRSFSVEVGRIVALLAPAFPAYGRTTVNGQQLLYGQPLEETDIGQSERMPVRSNIRELLQEVGLRSALIDVGCVRSGKVCLEGAMTSLARDADVLVCDSETDQDLCAIANASIALGPGTVLAGSAGLAYHVPRATGFVSAPLSYANESLCEGPTLFVIGSPSAVSREQAMLVASSPDVISVIVPPEVLMAETQSPEWQEHQQTMEMTLAAGTDLVVLIGAERSVKSEESQLLCAALARMVEPIAPCVGALVVTGGESARSVLEGWGVSCLRILGELETGLPLAVTEGWNRRLPVLTKAGGFGTPQTLLHCRKFLRELDRSTAAGLSEYKES